MVPREICTASSEKSNRCRKKALNVQKSAEAIVAGQSVKGQINRSPKYNRERRMNTWIQKTPEMVAAHREIVRNTKGT